MKIKTIDIQAKEWFDKQGGNSYFSAVITINHAMKGEKQFYAPFQYEYGDQYGFQSMEQLVAEGVIQKPKNDFELVPWRYAKSHGVIVRCSKIENCKKKDVVEFGVKS
jgi:hypothetical protein